jgi:hypothetical protein
VLLAVALALQTGGISPQPAGVRLHDVPLPPPAGAQLDSAAWGSPQLTIPTPSGRASVWLLRAADSVFVVARVPDRTPSWADGVSLCLDVSGDRAAAPAHDDFQLLLRRVLDSSVVYRGRDGRWHPPFDDPDWRVGSTHAGGGWEAAAASDAAGWSLVLRLDPAWFAGEGGRRPGIALIGHDNDPNSWSAWPSAPDAGPPQMLDRFPAAWMPILPPS